MQQRNVLPKGTRDFGMQFQEQRDRLARDNHRDIIYENAILLLQHCLVYLDFDDAISSGDTGRVQQSCELQLLMFHAKGARSKYGRELLRQQIERRFVWTPLMRRLYDDNALLSLSGRRRGFMPVDRYMEHQINQLKTGFPSAARVEARSYWQNLIAPNIIHFRNLVQSFSSSISASQSGTKHAVVKEEQDIRVLMELFDANKPLRFTGGRVGYGATDLFTNQFPEKHKGSTRYSEVLDLLNDGKSNL
jgi:hypothetical protein